MKIHERFNDSRCRKSRVGRILGISCGYHVYPVPVYTQKFFGGVRFVMDFLASPPEHSRGA
jgi:hypothetical protein